MSTANQNINEAVLVEGCRANDRQSQQNFYDRFSSKMYAVCLRYAGNSEDANDLLQEGFVKIFKHLDKFRGDGSLEGWVRRIFVNTSIEFLRRKKAVLQLPEVESIPIEDTALNGFDKISLNDVLKMVQKLSDGYRTVFNLFVIEGYTHKEIGEMLGINEGTSKSQLARAKNILQQEIKKVAF